MARDSYVMRFEVEEQSLPGGWYRISIFKNGVLIKKIERPTMREAYDALRGYGYEPRTLWMRDPKMTIKNIVTCDGCGAEVNPPRNSSWAAVMVVGPDGMQFSDSLGHLCESCKIDFRRWLQAKRAEHDKRAVQ